MTELPLVIGRIVIGIALFAVLLGLFARFDSLGTKSLWTDETFSLLRASGHGESEVFALFDGRVHSSDALAGLQIVGSSPGLGAAIASLHEEPQRGPLYYLLLRGWAQLTGNGIGRDRLLSAFLGVAGIGLAYLVGCELTRRRSGGMVLAALVALSPVEIRFSQQIREYVLLADLALLSVYLTARAIDRPSLGRFVAFGLGLLAGVYTNPTFVFLACAELIVAGIAAIRARRPAIALGPVAAAAAAALLYLPWALVATRSAAHGEAGVSWAESSYAFKASATKWVFNAGAVFFDSEYAHVRWGIVLAPLLAIAIYAVARAIARRGALVPRSLGLALTLATLVPLVALDLVHHSHFALIARYQMTTWIGIDVLVALLIVEGLAASRPSSRTLAACAFAFVMAAGCVSAAIDRTYSEWWDNNDHLSERSVAETIRARGPAGLVVANAVFPTFSLARYLAPATPMLLFGKNLPPLPHVAGSIYFLAPSPAVLDAVSTTTRRTPTNISPDIGLELHDLNAARAGVDPVSAPNALWVLEPGPLGTSMVRGDPGWTE